MKISVIADEVSPDLESALELIRMWGVDTVELRRAGERRYPDVTDYWKSRVPRLVKESGLKCVAISPGLFKLHYPGDPAPLHFHRALDIELFEKESKVQAVLEHHVNTVLPASIEAAKLLGCDMIICFSFQRQDHGPASEGAVQVLRHAAEKVGEAGLLLAIEVDEDLTARTVDLIKRVNHPALVINWDPGNAYRSGDDVPYPDAYELAKPFVRHVHFKDAMTDSSGERIWTLDGVIDWRGQMAALKADGFSGYISVEPHVRPKIAGALYTLNRIQTLMKEVGVTPAAVGSRGI
jgi:sugar phosphate isomerase/epimerase